MTEAETLYQNIGQQLKHVETSQMFGKPCLKFKEKAFAAFFKDQMVFKLQHEAHQAALSLKGATLFDPSGKGRPMKQWVQVPFEHQQKWLELTQEAIKLIE